MSAKEVDRAYILAKVREKHITLKEAAEAISLSYSQAKRLWFRYKTEGAKGLISKKRGMRSHRAVPEEKCQAIVQIIIDHYKHCGPLFISEKLREHHQITYSSEFIRRLMIKYHLWSPKQKKRTMHPRRERKEAEGTLVQADASDHDWFEGRGPKCHLHLFVDDATSKLLGGWFAAEETTEGYYRALQPILEHKGRPGNIYTDKRGTFVVNQGRHRKKTQFARAMKELNINMITAHSPQAKGRIERSFRTLQERLIWEMRIHRIDTIDEANVFLPKFIEAYNRKYGKDPRSPVNTYRPLNNTMPLKYILSYKEERTVSKNLEVHYQNQIYQLSAPDPIRLQKQKVMVITTVDGELAFEYRGKQLNYKRYHELEYAHPHISVERLMSSWKGGRSKKTKLSKHHPWKTGGCLNSRRSV